MILFAITGLLVFVILWIVFAPVSLRINTDLHKYEIVQPGTIRLAFDPAKRRVTSVDVLGIRVRKRQKKMASPASDKESRAKERSAWRLRRSTSTWLYLMRGVYQSFRIRHFIVTLDLDDVVLNAKLIPVVLLLNRGPFHVSTNLNNRYLLNTEIQLRVYRVLWCTLVFFLKK
jgi:hypothetical protein